MMVEPVPLAAFAEPGAEAIARTVGDNLRRIRVRKGLSLERLAKASGVSRAMLGQIELGRSAPTITILWKVARTLDVPLSAFTAPGGEGGPVVLRAHRAKILTSRNGRFYSRALLPADAPHRVEFHELRIAPQTVEEADPHAPGTVEALVVAKGVLEVMVDGERHLLDPGDSIQFAADRPHAYRNAGPLEAQAYLVMVFPDRIG